MYVKESIKVILKYILLVFKQTLAQRNAFQVNYLVVSLHTIYRLQVYILYIDCKGKFYNLFIHDVHVHIRGFIFWIIRLVNHPTN